jgi:transcriptional regulator with XRE-family HTH domain
MVYTLYRREARVMSDREFAKIFSKNLRRIAYNAGKSQADISRELKINKATVSSWMNGTRVPRMESVDMLCHYFNVKRSDLMEEYDDTPDEEKEQYYLSDEAREIAQFLFENPEYKVLFDGLRKVKKEDLEVIKTLIDKFS